MDTIKTYLENMFAALPRTAQILDLKNNILTNMEDKYLELKKQGKSENEAIGIVISEFGNIDELVSELGLNLEDSGSFEHTAQREEILHYMKVKKASATKISIGVFLCILAPIVLILIHALIDKGILMISETSGIVLLFILVTIAVGLFIMTRMSLEPFQYIEDGILLPFDLEKEIRNDYNSFMPRFNINIIIGVCLVVLSPISLFISSEGSDFINTIGLIIMLFIIDIAVVLFTLHGIQKECYERLLRIGDYVPKKKSEDKVIGAVASIVWPLAAVAFLISGFAYNLWHINWIIFPIVGILFGMFCAVYSILAEQSKG